MRFRWTAFILILLVALQSGVLSAAGPLDRSKKLEQLERDDFPLGRKFEISSGKKGGASAFRVQSFGGTQFSLEVACPSCVKDSLKIFVEGPLPSYGDLTPIGSGPKLVELKGGERNKIQSDLELKEKGVYRIIVSSESRPDQSKGKILISTSQLKNEVRPAEILSEMMSRLQETEREKIFGQIEKQIRYVVPDKKIQDPLIQELRKIKKERNWKALDRFPTFPPPHELKRFRPLLDGLKTPAQTNEGPLVVDLLDFIRAGKTDRDQKGDLLLSYPFEIRYGHHNSKVIPSEILNQSPKIAELLNSLSMNEKSLVTFQEPQTKKKHEMRNPKDFFDFLIRTGHQVELKEERTYANFLALEYQDRYSQIPVWVDTGVKLPDGTKLKVPLSHSHLSWNIKGPLVNARVAFFLGLYGVGFFPQIDERPAWTGMGVKQRFSTENGAQDLILRSAEAAQSYMQRIKREKEQMQGEGPADGYGMLGVCNDSTAALLTQLGIEQESSYPYPLMRASSLPEMAKGEWGEIFQKLPQDTVKQPQSPSLLCRILATTPYGLDSPYLPDEELRRQLKWAEEFSKQNCKRSQERKSRKNH